MCGIAGIWQATGEANQEKLKRMNATLRHRGPDDEGQWCAGSVGLAHRRLSILDVSSAGHQPMATPDGRWRLIFNGEIFNYRELAERQLSDISFMSTSDTEVLLHMLARYGGEAFQSLRGMYALALWDDQKKELLLARDPFGKKPLYYATTPQGLLFASEPKAILAALEEKPAIEPSAVTAYCSYEYVPAPATLWAGLQHVPAGTYQRWRTPGEYASTKFWQLAFSPKRAVGEATLVKELDAVLRQSVRRRLVSDVPVGLFLSGGLDSSTIGWYMRSEYEGPLHSFSVGFSERSFDETVYARRAAEHFNTHHHSIEFTLDTFHETLNELIPLMDMPLGDASLLPTYAISKLARQFCTVVLDGDGSDELFGGYGTFAAAALAEKLAAFSPLFPLLRTIAARWPTRYGDFSLDFKIKSFARGLGLPLSQRNQTWLGSFTAEELQHVLEPRWYEQSILTAATVAETERQAGLAVADQVSLLTIAQYLQNDILVKLDRATMGASVEARTPFLDIDVADFAARLPVRYKKDKYLLKKLMAARLPAEIVHRSKKGFGIPLGFWLRGPLWEWGRAVLAPDKLASDGIVRPAAVDQLWHEHRGGQADHRKKLWTLLSWQLWLDFWVKDRGPYKSTPLARR